MDVIGGENFKQIRAERELVFAGLADQRSNEKVILQQSVAVLDCVQAALQRMVPEIDEMLMADGWLERLAGFAVFEDEGVIAPFFSSPPM
jgi:hypothetical protein